MPTTPIPPIPTPSGQCAISHSSTNSFHILLPKNGPSNALPNFQIPTKMSMKQTSFTCSCPSDYCSTPSPSPSFSSLSLLSGDDCSLDQILPSLPQQEADWLAFGWLLDGQKPSEEVPSRNGNSFCYFKLENRKWEGNSSDGFSSSATFGSSATMELSNSEAGQVERCWSSAESSATVEMRQPKEADDEMDGHSEGAALDEEPVSTRTRSHSNCGGQQQKVEEGKENGGTFWEGRQFLHWLLAIEANQKRAKWQSKKRRRPLAKQITNKQCPQPLEKSRARRRRDDKKAGSKANPDPLGLISMVRVNGHCEGLVQESEEKLYCICQQPYDESRFYVGCDGCEGWFHPECVGTEQEEVSTMEGPFFCPSCKNAN